MRVKEIRILTVDVVALIFANIREPTEWNREFKFWLLKKVTYVLQLMS